MYSNKDRVWELFFKYLSYFCFSFSGWFWGFGALGSCCLVCWSSGHQRGEAPWNTTLKWKGWQLCRRLLYIQEHINIATWGRCHPKLKLNSLNDVWQAASPSSAIVNTCHATRFRYIAADNSFKLQSFEFIMIYMCTALNKAVVTLNILNIVA